MARGTEGREEQSAQGDDLRLVQFRNGLGLLVHLLRIGGDQLAEAVNGQKGTGQFLVDRSTQEWLEYLDQRSQHRGGQPRKDRPLRLDRPPSTVAGSGLRGGQHDRL